MGLKLVLYKIISIVWVGLYLKGRIKKDRLLSIEHSNAELLTVAINEFFAPISITTHCVHRTKILYLSGNPIESGICFQRPNSKRNIGTTILDNYHKKGQNFFHKWSGNWAMALWDEEQQQLLIARNKLGTKTIYYFDAPEFSIFSSDLGILLSLPFVPKELNHNAILQLGTGLKSDGQTFYKGINQLPKAHYITVSEDKLSLHNYWLPTIRPVLFYKRFEDYVEHFNEIYSQAIAESLAEFNKPGIALSSGLDSGSIFSVASPYLLTRQQQLEAVTWQPDVTDTLLKSPKRISNETDLVRKLISNSTNTNLHVVTSSQGNIIPFYNRIMEYCHQPIMNLQPHMMEVFEKGKEIGVDIMLNGFGGNFTVRHAGNPSQKIAHLQGIIGIIKSSSKNITNRFQEKQPNPSRAYINDIAIQENMAFYTPLTPELEQKRQQHSSQYAHIINLLQSTLIEDVSTYTESLRFESRTPVLDDRVIDFCLSVPNEVYREAGESKRLIKASMRNKIPHEVLYNSKRGLQGTNYVSKFEYESKQFNDLFRAFEKSKLISYWLDIELIKQHFQAFINPKTKSKTLLRTANFNVITRGVQLGLFLERFENGKY